MTTNEDDDDHMHYPQGCSYKRICIIRSIKVQTITIFIKKEEIALLTISAVCVWYRPGISATIKHCVVKSCREGSSDHGILTIRRYPEENIQQ